MSDSDSAGEEVTSREKIRRRRGNDPQIPKKLLRKKAKESPLKSKNALNGNRKRKPAQKNIAEGSSSESDDFNISSTDSVENHPPSRSVDRKKIETAKNGDIEPARGGRNAHLNSEDFSTEMGENDDEAEKRMRQRRRLSRSLHGEGGLNRSLNTSTGEVNAVALPDRAGLRSIYSTCIELFQAHKITQKNAFSLKLLECLDAIINGPDFDKNDMHMVGRTLEAGTRIYVCRVEHTHSEVMHLASDITVHNNKLKERNKNQEAENGEEGDFLNEEQYALEQRRKPVKRKKRSRFVEEDESKLCTDFEGQSTKYVTRRTTLKKKFIRMVNDEVDFDYLSYFVPPDSPHPSAAGNEDTGDEIIQLPSNSVNPEEMKCTNFIDFNLLTKFDPQTFDVWGKPVSDTNVIVTDCQQGEALPIDNEFVYNPETRPQEYIDYCEEGGDNGLHDISQPFGIEINDGDGGIDIRKPISVANITSLDQLGLYFAAIKNINIMTKKNYGWAGPQFFQPRRNWIRPATDSSKPKKGRKKREVEISYENIDWRNDENKYISTVKERTVLDERTIEKWSFTKTSVPYLGFENNEYGEEDDLTDAFSNVAMEDEESEDFVHPLLRFFIDPNRNIQSLLKKEIEKYGAVRDAGEFANDRGEFPDDSYLPFEDVEQARENEVDFCGSNGMLNGEPLGNENGPSAESEDQLGTILPGIFLSMGLNFEDDAMTRATDATDSIKYTKKPKPIDMHALKASVLRILTQKLSMDENGGPTLDNDTSTTMFELLERVYQSASKKTVENLSIPIIVVALMHVVADRKLFMLSGITSQMDNPVIVCRGKLWKHKDHIPQGYGIWTPEDEEQEK